MVAPAIATELSSTLANMDKAASGFSGMTADVKWVTYTALVDDTTVESGELSVQRPKGKSLDLKINFTDPYRKDLLVRGTKVELYKPEIATVEEYDLSNSKDKLEQALLIGFGVSGSYLRERYEVTMAGAENLDGVETVHLELTPKDADMRISMPKLEMWVSTKTWQPVQQKLHQEAAGDYRLYSYSNITINPPLSNSDFRLQLEGKVKRITPGK